jgi:hypothetical protein
VSTGGAVERDLSVSSRAETRDQKKVEGIRFCRAYPRCPCGEIEGPGGRHEREGSRWRLNEAQGSTKEGRGRQGLEVERGQLSSSKLVSDNQRRKGREKGEHAGSSESERKLRGGEYIHNHRHSLNTMISVLYKWQPKDIVAESNCVCVQTETLRHTDQN